MSSSEVSCPTLPSDGVLEVGSGLRSGSSEKVMKVLSWIRIVEWVIESGVGIWKREINVGVEAGAAEGLDMVVDRANSERERERRVLTVMSERGEEEDERDGGFRWEFGKEREINVTDSCQYFLNPSTQ